MVAYLVTAKAVVVTAGERLARGACRPFLFG
jgi:hypothetical protein